MLDESPGQSHPFNNLLLGQGTKKSHLVHKTPLLHSAFKISSKGTIANDVQTDVLLQRLGQGVPHPRKGLKSLQRAFLGHQTPHGKKPWG